MLALNRANASEFLIRIGKLFHVLISKYTVVARLSAGFQLSAGLN